MLAAKRGPKTITTADEIVTAIWAVLAATRFMVRAIAQGVRARLVHHGLRIGAKRVLRLMTRPAPSS
jgi:hypothetical protein